jgi:hypothetical protein
MITLNRIRAHSPCSDGWAKLLAYLGKSKADDAPLSLLTVLESNGLDDALWCLRVVEGHDAAIRLFACDCAERVLPIFERSQPGDSRPRHAIETARRFARGEATSEEKDAAGDAAWAAAWAAAGDAAGAAAWAAAGDAARAAAGAAAWAAARAAAWAAARAAAGDAAGDAAWDAERQWQTQRLRQIIAEIET